MISETIITEVNKPGISLRNKKSKSIIKATIIPFIIIMVINLFSIFSHLYLCCLEEHQET